MRPPRPRGPTMAAVLAACLLTASCGGREPPGEEAGGPRTVTGTAPSFARGVPAVVLLRPTGGLTRPAPADTLVMDQFGMAFSPGLLLIGKGQTVRFQNSEDVVHNVQVRSQKSDSTLFNVGTLRGAPYHHRFDAVGAYDVFCDIHPGMTAVLLVHDASVAVRAGRDGSFVIEDVPSGSYVAEVWSADPALRSIRDIEIGPARVPLDLGVVR